jgi:hypothetical protein
MGVQHLEERKVGREHTVGDRGREAHERSLVMRRRHRIAAPEKLQSPGERRRRRPTDEESGQVVRNNLGGAVRVRNHIGRRA